MVDDRPRVLLVDDDEMVRLTVTDMLEAAGYQVCGEAADGLQAIEAVSRLEPDVIFMDICMPRMDGIQAARVINSTWPTPTLFLTALMDREMIAGAAEAGAFAYLVKPVRQSDIAPAIETATSRFRETQRHRRRAQTTGWEMQAVRTLAEEIARGAGTHEVVDLALRYVARGLQVPAVALLLRAGSLLRVWASVGLNDSYCRSFGCRQEGTFFGRAISANAPQKAIGDSVQEIVAGDPLSFGACHSLLAAPIAATLSGCLVAYRVEPVPFTREETNLLATVACELGVALRAAEIDQTPAVQPLRLQALTA